MAPQLIAAISRFAELSRGDVARLEKKVVTSLALWTYRLSLAVCPRQRGELGGKNFLMGGGHLEYWWPGRQAGRKVDRKAGRKTDI